MRTSSNWKMCGRSSNSSCNNFRFRNYPPTYMEQFCRSLHPDLDLGPICVSWFRQAAEHCTDLLMADSKGARSHFWATVKSFIFFERHTDLVSQKIPISIHPNRLTAQACHSLFLDIVNDYIVRAPRFSAESATNVVLWQVLYSVMGVLALGSLLVGTIFAYRKLGRPLEKRDPLKDVFKPENRVLATARRSMRIAQYELHRLHVQHLVQREELFAPDGTRTLVVAVSSKLETFNGLVAGSAQAIGRLYCLAERHSKPKPDCKTETVAKALRFVSSYSRKLRILLVFEEDPVYEELPRTRKAKSPPFQTRTPSPSSASSKSEPIPFRRFVTGHTRVASNNGSSAIGRPQPDAGLRKGSPHPSSTPRSGAVARPSPTQIPRNCPRRSSTFSSKK